MALKALLLRSRIDTVVTNIAALRAQDDDFERREAEFKQAIEEMTAETTEEERSAVEASAAAFETELQNHRDAIAAEEERLSQLREELAAEEARQATTPPAAPEQRSAEHEERRENITMNTRNRIFARMDAQQRTALLQRQDVRDYISTIRTTISEKRALTNVGLTIPEVLLGLLRENIEAYSKLYKHVNVMRVRGEGRQLVQGTIPEAVWTECCANLNELALGFNDAQVDCFKVAGFFAICNANLEDSDIDLLGTVLTAIGQAIGLALDKAILYGRNASGSQNMPQGIVSRLVQTAAPSGYPATARPWADLHTTNVKAIGTAQSPLTGIALFKQIIIDSAAAKSNYAYNGMVWCMNETTRKTLQAEALSVNAAGAIVSGFEATMPVLGGPVETLDFIPDGVVIGGYFDDYLLAERAGQKFASSEHVKFLQDQTVMKGTARYDGLPVIAEAFVALGILGTAPTATMTFASDTANAGE